MRSIFLATLLALLCLPPVTGAPALLTTSTPIQANTEWGFPGFFGRCDAFPAVFSYEHVNSRVLLSLHSTHEIATDAQVPYTETECAISFVIEPTITINPCDMPRGEASPALTTADPYYYPIPGYTTYWTKHVDFANGGYFELTLVESAWSNGFYGECRSGSTWARYYATWDPIRAG